MRHNVERYRMLLRTESNSRARRILIDMIAELESRPVVSSIRIPRAKDGPPVVRRRVTTAPRIGAMPPDAPDLEAEFN